MIKYIGSCVNCAYPISVRQVGESVHCPWCSTENVVEKLSNGTVPVGSILKPLAVTTAVVTAILLVIRRKKK